MTHTPEEELAALRACLWELVEDWRYYGTGAVSCVRELRQLANVPGEDLVSWFRVGGGS